MMKCRSLELVVIVGAVLLAVPRSAFAQCGLTGQAGTAIQCVSSFPYDYPMGIASAVWSGGIPPYTVSYDFAGTGPFMLIDTYETSIYYEQMIAMDYNQCGPTYLHVVDSEGCEFEMSSYECFYAIDPTDQFMVASSVWDPITSTSTITLVDDPADHGNVVGSSDLLFSLYRTDLPLDQGIGGGLDAYYHPSPPRYEFPGLVPGDYSLWIESDVYCCVFCWGEVLQFTVVNESPDQVTVSSRVLLGGPYAGNGLMNDHLRSTGLIPTTEPYEDLGYIFTGSHGSTSTSTNLFTAPGDEAIVDWVVAELRGTSAGNPVIASRAALVRRDGQVVSSDGSHYVTFNVPSGQYHFSVRHRNHLGVMTAVPIALSATSTTIDFTDPGTPTWGTDARKNINGTMVLWPGDVNFDGSVRYTGPGNDRDIVLQAIGGTTPSNVISNVYSNADINLDGTVKYTGADNDRDIILQTIGGVVPTEVKVAQIP